MTQSTTAPLVASPGADALRLFGDRVGTWECDPDGAARVSPRLMALLGRGAEETSFSSAGFRLLVHPHDQEAVREARETLFSEKAETVAIDLHLLHAEGGYVALNGYGCVIARDGPGGRPTRIGGVAFAPETTVTGDTRHDPKALALRETRDGTAIADAGGYYTFMNPAHRRMFGIEPGADVTALHWSDLYAPEVRTLIEREVFPVLTQTGSWSGELRGRRLDNAEPVQQEVSLTLASGGGIICATRDISERLRGEAERARLREQLLVSQRYEVVHALTAGAAHDLRNLLGLVQQRASGIEAGLEDDPAAAAATITETVQEAVRLLNDRLALGRDTGDGYAPLDLRAPLAKAAELVGATLPPGIALDLDLPEAAVMLSARHVDVVQMVLNLMINAADAVDPTSGRITLALDRVPGAAAASPGFGTIDIARRYARISVRDNGPGFSPGISRTMFDPFVSTKGQGGTGLGMFVVAEMTRAYGGAIITTTQPAQGASVEVLLPLGRSPVR